MTGYMKPISTLMKPLRSVDLATMTESPAAIERSDVCAVPAAAVVAEAMVAIVLADAVVEKFGGDSVEELVANWQAFTKRTAPAFSARRNRRDRTARECRPPSVDRLKRIVNGFPSRVFCGLAALRSSVG